MGDLLLKIERMGMTMNRIFSTIFHALIFLTGLCAGVYIFGLVFQNPLNESFAHFIYEAF